MTGSHSWAYLLRSAIHYYDAYCSRETPQDGSSHYYTSTPPLLLSQSLMTSSVSWYIANCPLCALQLSSIMHSDIQRLGSGKPLQCYDGRSVLKNSIIIGNLTRVKTWRLICHWRLFHIQFIDSIRFVDLHSYHHSLLQQFRVQPGLFFSLLQNPLPVKSLSNSRREQFRKHT